VLQFGNLASVQIRSSGAVPAITCARVIMTEDKEASNPKAKKKMD
jgi:hypothetical protein